jgi:hypothetical protein
VVEDLGQIAAAPFRDPFRRSRGDRLATAEGGGERAALAAATEAVTGHGSAAAGAGAGHAATETLWIGHLDSGQRSPRTIMLTLTGTTPYKSACDF